MSQKYPYDFECEECGTILRALLDSFHVDQREILTRLSETAQSSGRGLEEVRSAWTSSLSKMPFDEAMRVYYPTIHEARRKKRDHEALTGHSVHMHGWSGAFGRRLFGGRPPGANVAK
jgi:hypothetical protein